MQALITATRSLFCLFCATSLAVEILPPGHRPESPGTHALVGGTVVTKPGEQIQNGTVIIRDGKIQQVGVGLEVPPDARLWDMRGTVIYAGFIDPYLTLKPRVAASFSPRLDEHTHSPQATDYNFLGAPGQSKDPGNPGPGYGLIDVTPEKRVAETYANDSKNMEAMRELGFAAGNVIPEKGILRGSSAFVLLREDNPSKTIFKADVWQHLAIDQATSQDERYPNSLMGQIAVIRQAIFDAKDYALRKQYQERSGDESFRPSFNLSLEALLSSLSSQGSTPQQIHFAIEPGSVLMVDRMGYIARELGIAYVMVASGQEWRRPDLVSGAAETFIVPVNFPEIPKLPEPEDWESVSLDQLRSWDWAPENAALLRQKGREIALTTYGLAERKNFRRNLRLALDRGLSEEDALAALTVVPARICKVDQQFGTIAPGKVANLTVVEGDYFVPTNKVREVWVQGRVHRVQPGGKHDPAVPRPDEAKDKLVVKEEAEEKRQEQEKQIKKREILSERTAKSPQEGRGPLAKPPIIHVKGATIWTSGPEGRIQQGDLIVENGKIKAVGQSLTAPVEAHVIDGRGKHVTPGLIDCHSHAMILGGVNEGTLPSTAMVRIEDVINSETRRIFEQLAGGLTIANLLHGSANPIGGQNCVIKLRYGASPEELKMEGAPTGIKFALGENVKQSNWGDRNVTRFPQTRMGVPTFIANRFTAALRYLEAQKEHGAKNEGAEVPSPRRDLELETLGEILQGKRLLHCHSYRQDEILAFLRLMESFGIKVATLQHVLEGYKVADEMARHGVGASCFTDWWAFKYEVIDAIPFAGSLMHQRGVLVSFKSDSADLARRLNLEAAKAVKYGGLSEEEALNFVTINPARQLRIDHQVGSLEPGKDADFVLWSGSPLDTRTICLETWIDGQKYFDRSGVEAERKAFAAEREQLLQKAKRVAGLTKGEQGNDKAAQAAFFQLPLELLYENVDRHCDSE